MQFDLMRSITMPFKGHLWFEKIFVGCFIGMMAGAVQYIPYVGGLLSLVLVCLVSGYTLRVMRSETAAPQDQIPDRLPEWDEWGTLVGQGLLLTVAQLVYACLIGALMVGIAFVLGGTGLFASIAAGTVPQLWTLLLLLSLVFIGAVAYGLFMPMMAVHFAHEQRFLAAFEVRRIFDKLCARPGNVVLVLLGSLFTLFLAVLLTLFTFGLALPGVTFLFPLMSGHLWAQIYRLADQP